MDYVLTAFLIFGSIIFFGFLAEFIFKKFKVPDVLLLIIFGVMLGPFLAGLVLPSYLVAIAPIFTAFALMFLLFDGAFNIDIVSFFKGLGKGMTITWYNFILSSLAISFVMIIFGFPLPNSILLGFTLGGVSSAFVLPIISNVRIKKETYSILTIESAVTDVLSVVFAVTAINIIALNSFSFRGVSSTFAALFIIAGFFGILAGVLWILLIGKIFKKNKSYMLTIGYLFLLYTVTEYLNGNGAIAALFFGLVLKNSEKWTPFLKGGEALVATTPTEKLFYSQISFFLKTFFFVYIGVLLDFSDLRILLIGFVIAFVIMLIRHTNSYLTKNFPLYDRMIINSIFARGLASAVIAQLAIQNGVPGADVLAKIAFSGVMFTIILSSTQIFLVNRDIDIIKLAADKINNKLEKRFPNYGKWVGSRGEYYQKAQKDGKKQKEKLQ